MPLFRVIGLWLGDGAPGWPDVHDFVDSSDEGRATIVARLTSGVRTDRAYMGYSRCRFCGVQNGSGELTNGVLIWPEGLAHYVRDHQVRLPSAVESLLLENPEDDVSVEAAVRAAKEDRDVEWWRSVATVL